MLIIKNVQFERFLRLCSDRDNSCESLRKQFLVQFMLLHPENAVSLPKMIAENWPVILLFEIVMFCAPLCCCFVSISEY